MDVRLNEEQRQLRAAAADLADDLGPSSVADLEDDARIARLEKALDAVTAVDPDTYFYGEGWNFGEVANNARGVNAIQPNMAGSNDM